MMTYEEAQEMSLQVKWKTSTCSQGEECWCRTIVPVEPILYSEYQMIDTEQEYTIVRPGELNQELAEHFVRLHNNWIDDERE
jgi:hypothetical protein